MNASAQQPQDSGEALEALQVRPNVYMIAGGNIAVQIGPLGAILINAGSEQMSGKVLVAVKTLTSLPIRYIIDPSMDADFVGGNAKLSKAGVTILSGAVGQVGVTEDVINNGGIAIVLAHENVPIRMSAPTGQVAPFPEAIWPSKTYAFKRGYAMYLNGCQAPLDCRTPGISTPLDGGKQTNTISRASPSSWLEPSSTPATTPSISPGTGPGGIVWNAPPTPRKCLALLGGSQRSHWRGDGFCHEFAGALADRWLDQS